MQQKAAEPLVVGTLAAVSAHEAIHVRVSHLGNKCIIVASADTALQQSTLRFGGKLGGNA